ncbi:MAG: ferrous iron transport protein B [Muribaculaceae bacterium]|nr:ferrous iron transport protein B [Muribaculaceae bacterium]
MRLSELNSGEQAIVVKIHGHGAFRKRVMEMGFVRGRNVEAILSAPLRDPIKYRLMGYEVSLRRSEADLIEVVPDGDAPEAASTGGGTIIAEDCESFKGHFHTRTHTINVALIGNPNCGKTSLFNIASGASEHVGNYSGVTVDAKKGTFQYRGYKFNLVDLPGTYSLSAYSPEELYVRRYLKDENPDIILNVVDASNLERNLYLTTELIDMDRPMVIALNMFDELKRNGSHLDYRTLGRMIGVPIVPTTARTGEGIDKLFDTIIDVYEYRHSEVRHVHVSLGSEVERAVNAIKDAIKSDNVKLLHFAPRYLAIKLLERDAEIERIIRELDGAGAILAERDRLTSNIEKIHNEDINSLVANEKYGFIAGALAETMEVDNRTKATSTQIIDTFVTNKLFGFPIFLAIMFFIFWMTFAVGQYPQNWIQSLVDLLSDTVSQHFPDGPLKDLLADGVIGGVGGVIVFLPNILILYFFISFMEDSGYMARAAFIMDKLMHRIGLHGKSFIPLMMGFGCNVPAIMATRSIESRSSRIITVLINPFMSCSARLPLYVLLVGAFFPAHAALVIMSLYILGVLAAVLTAKLLRRFFFKRDETPFVMELPPYRMPTFKATLRHMWGKGKEYLKKMGGIILVGSIVVWALNYFPLHNNEVVQAQMSASVSDVQDDSRIDTSHDSYLEMIGKTITPVMSPLGFHWRATIAVLAGVPAKEIVVSTLGVLYTGDDVVEESTLGERLKASGDFGVPAALSLMVFILLYCPCIASVTAISRETGSWRYGAFSVLYNTALAWVASFAVYRLALLF